MPTIKIESVVYEYTNYEEYLGHAAEVIREGWEFLSQRNNHKEVTWIKYHKQT